MVKRLPKGADASSYDFDHPSSLNMDLLYKCLLELLKTGQTEIPVYCFKTHSPLPNQSTKLKTKKLLVLEGILSMYDERIRNLCDLKIFIHCDADIALARRILRDIKERGRDVTEVLNRYNNFVKEDYEKYVKPQMKYCDLIIPGGASNDKALQLLVENLKTTLDQKD